MKKFKLKLDKQSKIRLSGEETTSVQGGGYTRSNNNGGLCKYSSKNPRVLLVKDGDGRTGIIGCTRRF